MNYIKRYVSNFKESCLYVVMISSLMVGGVIGIYILLSGVEVIPLMRIIGITIGFMIFIGLLADIILFRPGEEIKGD